MSEWLSVGGKSLVEYTDLFMIGCFVFADEKIISIAEKNSRLLFGIGLVATILNVYLFIWADIEYILLNTITKYVSEWIMVIALIGLAKRYLNFKGFSQFLFMIYQEVFCRWLSKTGNQLDKRPIFDRYRNIREDGYMEIDICFPLK